MTEQQPKTVTTDPDRLPPRGLASALFNAAHDCFAELHRQHHAAWQTLRMAPDEAIVLYPCFVDGRATTAIGLAQRIGNKMLIMRCLSPRPTPWRSPVTPAS